MLLGINMFWALLRDHFNPQLTARAEMSRAQNILRLLPTFAGALRQKNRTRVSLDKTLTNYIS